MRGHLKLEAAKNRAGDPGWRRDLRILCRRGYPLRRISCGWRGQICSGEGGLFELEHISSYDVNAKLHSMVQASLGSAYSPPSKTKAA
jgi:hypothetical protein